MCTTAEPFSPRRLRAEARKENLAGINRRLARLNLSHGKRAKLETQRKLLHAAIERGWVDASMRPYCERSAAANHEEVPDVYQRG